MVNVFREAFMAGVGAIGLSSDYASKLVKELVKAGELRAQDERVVLDDMLKKAAAAKKQVESTISRQLDAAYKRMNLVTRDQLETVERRLQDLEKRSVPKSRSAKSPSVPLSRSTRTPKVAATSTKRSGKKTARK